MRFLRLALFCAFSLRLAEATAIVAVVFPGAVYIAADSRLTKTSAASGSTAISDGCKIVQTPAIAFAVSALSSDSRTGFDFSEIA
ncbi:MAG TPA: hypothetical protein VG297_08640, partial [Bryobacteraceae bacterium]|nr:hypothetical protein [Bryobacteraceae bacterium]